MPCHDFENVTQEQILHDREMDKVRKKLDEVTRIACELFKLLDSNHTWFAGNVSKEALAWWHDHKKKDFLRVRQEALAKLTPEEREVLGV